MSSSGAERLTGGTRAARVAVELDGDLPSSVTAHRLSHVDPGPRAAGTLAVVEGRESRGGGPGTGDRSDTESIVAGADTAACRQGDVGH